MKFNTTRGRFLVTLLLASLALIPAVAAAQTPLNAVLAVGNGTPSAENARVRVVHGSPDAPNVDVRADGALLFENLAFEEVSSYLEVPPATYRVQVEPAGADNNGPFVIDEMLMLEAGRDYTVVASDLLANITPVVLVDDNSAPSAGDARVTFFHGAPDAPAVDIALTNGPVLIPNTSFGNAANPISVPAGTYDLEVRAAGGTDAVLTLPGVTLTADTVYSVFATGLLGDGAADRTLYLNDGRFRVETTWTDFEGGSGFGRAIPFLEDSGAFWFFDHQNAESVVKVLDGRDTNGNFWVFYGSLSNVAFEVTVTDTTTNTTKTYTNPAGTFASFGDTEAFPGS